MTARVHLVARATPITISVGRSPEDSGAIHVDTGFERITLAAAEALAFAGAISTAAKLAEAATVPLRRPTGLEEPHRKLDP